MKNDPEKKIKDIVEAAGRIESGDVLHVLVQHEDGCPAISTQRITDCICKPKFTRAGRA